MHHVRGAAPTPTNWLNQAIETAMNASKNINTPPTIGSTMGIRGTMASVASGVCAGVASWVAS